MLPLAHIGRFWPIFGSILLREVMCQVQFAFFFFRLTFPLRLLGTIDGEPHLSDFEVGPCEIKLKLNWDDFGLAEDSDDNSLESGASGTDSDCTARCPIPPNELPCPISGAA
jgi:hypothetical protein